ncbi:DUF4388 domain-containing protein [Nevskia soli]|uniref:DUF4388 domain-containing protein n=1 Tax=Nevskia soli TaxID=418856 RepID=UPI0004A6B7F2|nr:DUF4388 domain-containing protein [Nevskia soli]
MSAGNQALVEALQKLCAEGATGTLFLTLPDRRQARIGLLRGRMVHLTLFTLRGELVIRALANRPPLSFSFHPGNVSEEQGELPDTAVILQRLGGSGGGAEPGPVQVEASAPALPESVMRVVTQELAHFVGPMASILVAEQAGATSLERLLAKLSLDLDNRDEIEAFRHKVLDRLKGGH